MEVKTQKIKMPLDNNEQANFWVKAGMYIVGIVLGLTAKLAMLNKEKTLTVKDFILHASVAFSAAWVVWAILAHYGQLDLANIASVIVGRYADYILVAIWRSIKNIVNKQDIK